MKLDKDDFTALFGTIIIHLIVLFLLFFGVLRAFVPLDDGGVPVNFGELTAVAGIYQPSSSSTVAQQSQNPPPPQQTTPQPRQRQTPPQQRQTPTQQRPTPPPQQNQPRQTTNRPASTQPRNERVVTQDREQTAAVPATTKNENLTAANEVARKEKEAAERLQREEEARIQREEDARRQREEEQRRQQEAIDNRTSNAFGAGSPQANSRGDAPSGISNPGNPYGDPNARSIEGSGGVGPSFNLSGRTTGSGGLPRPTYNEREEGRIVINITVDPNGNVIAAEIGRGTNIVNITMRNNALDAARRAKFNRIQGSNNQTGTITYNYKYL